jgi:NAD(P)-dependent dehydrogenase (short-subunit alcohol dehydrogenase family)
VVADLNIEGGKAVAALHTNLHFISLNVTLVDEWKKLVDQVKSSFGRIDILVNNAGTSYPNKPTLQVTEAEYSKCFDVNVRSIFWSVPTVVQAMIDQGEGGSVINVASIGALRPRGGLVWYNASKGAAYNATKGLAAEFAAQKIRFNGVLPLLSATGLWSTFTGTEDTPENRSKFIGNVPLGRLADADDIANAILYYASDESSFVTGTMLEVDGGRAIS